MRGERLIEFSNPLFWILVSITLLLPNVGRSQTSRACSQVFVRSPGRLEPDSRREHVLANLSSNDLHKGIEQQQNGSAKPTLPESDEDHLRPWHRTATFKDSRDETHSISSDGAWIISLSHDEDATRFTNAVSGKPQWLFNSVITQHYRRISPNGRFLYQTGPDLRSRDSLVDLAEGNVVSKNLMESSQTLDASAFSADSSRFAMATSVKNVVGHRHDLLVMVDILDPATGREVLRLIGDGEPIMSMDFSPNGDWIATLDRGGRVRVWKARGGQGGGRTEESVMDFTMPVDDVDSNRLLLKVRFSPDSSRLIVAAHDKIRIHDMKTNRPVKEILTINGHFLSVNQNSSGNRLVVKDGNQSLRILDARSGAGLQTFPRGLRAPALSPDGRLLLSLNESNVIQVRLVSTGEVLFELNAPERPKSAVFTPDGKKILVDLGDSIEVWEQR